MANDTAPNDAAATDPSSKSTSTTSTSGPLSSKETQGLDPKTAGIWGIVTIALGNVATLAGKIEKVNEQVQKVQEQLHLGSTPYLLYVVLAIIFVGYLLASSPFYKTLKTRIGGRNPAQKIIIPAAVLLVVSALYVLNLMALPLDVNRTQLKAGEPRWADQIRGTQKADGGFSIMLPTSPGNPEQAFVTAQGLTAIISTTEWDKVRASDLQVIRSAFDYIDSQRNTNDGGWPYFGKDGPSLTEINAWVTVARIKALEHSEQIWPSESEQAIQLAHVSEDLEKQIMSRYIPAENAWSPLSLSVFTRAPSAPSCSMLPQPQDDKAQSANRSSLPQAISDLQSTSKSRTYSTIMALWALLEAHRVERVNISIGHKYDDPIRSGIGWLLTNYQRNTNSGTWVPNPHRANQREDYPGLTGQTIFVLYRAVQDPHFKGAVEQPSWNDARHNFLNERVKEHLLGDNAHLSDMDAYVFPYPQPLEPMTFLWAPWSMVAYRYLSDDATLSSSDRQLARDDLSAILGNYQPEAVQKVESGATYELAENLFCATEAFR